MASSQTVSLEFVPVDAAKTGLQIPTHIARIKEFKALEISGIQDLSITQPNAIQVGIQKLFPEFDDDLTPELLILDRWVLPETITVAGTIGVDQPVEVNVFHWRGQFGNGNWMNLSLGDAGLFGQVMWRQQLWVIEPAANDNVQSGSTGFIMYNLTQMGSAADGCETDTSILGGRIQNLMASLPGLSLAKRPAAYTIDIAVESPFEMFVFQSEDAQQATAYLLSLMAGTSAILEFELGVALNVVFTRVWTTDQDPYANAGTTAELRSYWNQEMDHVDRHVTMLLLPPPASGGDASLGTLGDKNEAYGRSSADLGAIAHELGHVMGSPHTHNCGWPVGPNGEFGPIDRCGAVEGSCPASLLPTETADGSIMSYCNSSSFYYHPLVKKLLLAAIEMAPGVGEGGSSTTAVEFRVVDSQTQAGVPGVTITARRGLSDTSSEQGTAITDSQGRVTWPLLNGEIYTITGASKEGYAFTAVDHTSFPLSVQVLDTAMGTIELKAYSVALDVFEPDNSSSTSSEVEVGAEAQERTLSSDSDVDHIHFQAEAGTSYVIRLQSSMEDWNYDASTLDASFVSPAPSNVPIISLFSGGPSGFLWTAEAGGQVALKIEGKAQPYSVQILKSPFSQIQWEGSSNLNGIELNAVVGDIDGDGNFDLIANGFNLFFQGVFEVWTQQAGSLVSEPASIETCITIFPCSTLLLADIDSDGDLDLFSSKGSTARLHLNSGGQFSGPTIVQIGANGTGRSLGDVDGDGDVDILSGVSASASLTKVGYMQNDGSGSFTYVGPTSLDPSSKVIASDVDLDGDMDIIRVASIAGESILSVWKNEDGVFEAVPQNVELMSESQYIQGLALVDLDNDGDQDMVLSDWFSGLYETRVFLNDNGVFSRSQVLQGAANTSISRGDIDNDGDLDVLVVGGFLGGSYKNPETLLFLNSNGALSLAPYSPYLLKSYGSAPLVDLDKDGLLDLLQVGYGQTLLQNAVRVSKGTLQSSNQEPSAPTGLRLTADGRSSALFEWNSALDDTTPSEALTYAMRVGTTPSGIDVLAPLSNASTGAPLVPQRGNVDAGTFHRLTGLEDGKTYYWSVQAVDHGYARSGWSPEQSFTFMAMNQAPNASVSASMLSGRAPMQVSFDGAASSDPDGDTLEYSWEMGDGTSYEGPNVTHTYSNPGTYAASLTVSDGLATDTAEVEVTVVANQLPVVILSSSAASGQAPLEIAFDASGSTDADGDVLSFSWDMGDGATYDTPAISHVFVSAGTFMVKLTASDGFDSVSDSTQVVVASGVFTERDGLPEAYVLMPAYPNPFNPSTNVRFGLPTASEVTIVVADILGRQMSVLVSGEFLHAGYHDVRFDARTLPSGTYLIQMQAGEFSATSKVILLK